MFRNVAAGKTEPAPLVRLNRWHIGRSAPGVKAGPEASSHRQAGRGAGSLDARKPYRIEVGGKIFEGNDPRSLLRLAVEARRAQRKRGTTSVECRGRGTNLV